MEDGSQDAIDFKPFFDMVVGVLFILLILVAAQMFFAQWQPQASKAPTAEQEERQRREELEREVQDLLGRIEARLGAAGVVASVDRVGRSISIGEAALRDANGAWSTRALAIVGTSLRAELSCLGQGLAPEAGCPSYRQLKLRRLEAGLGLAARGGEPAQSPAARVQALELSAALFRGTPDLLALEAPGGGPLVDSAARLDASPAASRLELRFGVLDGS